MKKKISLQLLLIFITLNSYTQNNVELKNIIFSDTNIIIQKNNVLNDTISVIQEEIQKNDDSLTKMSYANRIYYLKYDNSPSIKQFNYTKRSKKTKSTNQGFLLDEFNSKLITVVKPNNRITIALFIDVDGKIIDYAFVKKINNKYIKYYVEIDQFIRSNNITWKPAKIKHQKVNSVVFYSF